MSKALIVNEERVFTDFEKLSKKSKKEVADFIAFLRAKEELEATKEIISDTDFLKSIMRGDEDFKARRFRKWSEVREDV
jgi:phosphoketolase